MTSIIDPSNQSNETEDNAMNQKHIEMTPDAEAAKRHRQFGTFTLEQVTDGRITYSLQSANGRPEYFITATVAGQSEPVAVESFTNLFDATRRYFLEIKFPIRDAKTGNDPAFRYDAAGRLIAFRYRVHGHPCIVSVDRDHGCGTYDVTVISGPDVLLDNHFRVTGVFDLHAHG